jgi:DNA-binding transcriptional regulator LsrR (DeoR family)
MAEQRTARDRNSLLADVAEMYYIDEMSQADVTRVITLPRSIHKNLERVDPNRFSRVKPDKTCLIIPVHAGAVGKSR